jgi:hypothetical protein
MEADITTNVLISLRLDSAQHGLIDTVIPRVLGGHCERSLASKELGTTQGSRAGGCADLSAQLAKRSPALA